MKNFSRVGVALSAIAGIVSAAYGAAPIAGVWHGHISFDVSKLPKATDPAQKQQMDAQLKMFSQIKFTLTLKGDNTFSMVTSGGPGQRPATTGTYTATSTSVTIHPAGKAPTGPKTFNIAKDGKSLSLNQGPATIVFVK